MKTAERERKLYITTIVGTVVNLLLIALKFIAAVLGRSSAMMADAIHSLSDLVTDVVVIVFVKVASKPSDDTHEYGHGKYETMASLLVGIILLLVGIGVFIEGSAKVIDACKGAVLPRPGMWALAVAAASIVLKEIVFRYTLAQGKRYESLAVIANAWHHRSDAFSSLGTLIGIAGAMFLGEKWRVLDPIAAIIVSIFIVKVSIDIIRPCFDELLEKSLPDSTESEIRAIIRSVDGIQGIGKFHTRRLGNRIAIEAHVKMDGDLRLTQAHHLASEAERILRERFGHDTHISIHMEPKKE